ncbi:ABC transporter substrate-binding protein [Halosolutus gelatinilyticus]|uniref:ABC transporter substrate-binding protein n=1 Tax=Halosolutus gelatinilyticus TaxID=2931975 RepID=UPI001FF4E9B9|nr:ABC transporter substrate-binding protein [Halosolutus gelatinilyticus]
MDGDTHSTNRRDLLAGIGAAGAAALAGCSALARTPPGPHLRIGTLRPPVTLDPIEAKYVGSKQAINRIFDGLYAYGPDTETVPKIAAGRPTTADDGRRIDVTIDEAARFQNDRRVRPEDVMYSFEAPVEEGTAPAWEVDAIESVEALDDHTVRFHLRHPFPTVSYALTRPIVPKEAREADRAAFAKKPIGSGPFEVRKFSEEQKTQLVRWGEYWGRPEPEIAQLTMVYVKSPLTQMMSLRTGRSEAIEPVNPQIADDIRDVTDADVYRQNGYRTYYFGCNLNEGPTTDPKVREAISYCIDVDKAVDEFIKPVGNRVYSPLPGRIANDWNMPIGEWKEIPNRKSTDRAKQLFREADETPGRLRILTSKDPTWKELGEAIAGGIRDAGHGALVTAKPWKRYLESYVSGSERDYSVFVGEIAGTADPDSFLYPTFHENMLGVTNGIFSTDDEIMKPLSEARSMTDRKRRRSRYETAITKLLTDRVVLPICSFENSFATAQRVRNFEVHPIAEVNPRLAGEDEVVRVRS